MDAITTSTQANHSLSYDNVVDNTAEWDTAFIDKIASQSKTDGTATKSEADMENNDVSYLNQSEVKIVLTQMGITEINQQDAILSLFPTLEFGGAISVADFIKKFDIDNDDKIDGFEINNTLHITSQLDFGYDNAGLNTLNKQELQDFFISITDETQEKKEEYIKQILANIFDFNPKSASLITRLAQGLTDEQGAKDLTYILGGYNADNPEIKTITMTAGISNAFAMLEDNPNAELSDLAVLNTQATGTQGVTAATTRAISAVTGTPPTINADILYQALTQISNADTGEKSDAELRERLLTQVFTTLGVSFDYGKILELATYDPKKLIDFFVLTQITQEEKDPSKIANATKDFQENGYKNFNINPELVAYITDGEIRPELSSVFQ